MILLTNRVHPTRENDAIPKPCGPRVADAVVRALAAALIAAALLAGLLAGGAPVAVGLERLDADAVAGRSRASGSAWSPTPPR